MIFLGRNKPTHGGVGRLKEEHQGTPTPLIFLALVKKGYVGGLGLNARGQEYTVKHKDYDCWDNRCQEMDRPCGKLWGGIGIMRMGEIFTNGSGRVWGTNSSKLKMYQKPKKRARCDTSTALQQALSTQTTRIRLSENISYGISTRLPYYGQGAPNNIFCLRGCQTSLSQ